MAERFATKDEILKNLKKAYKSRRLTYKDYMLEVNRTEKHYDEWLAAYEKANGETKYDMTNEELAIGKRMEELQAKPTSVQEQENEAIIQLENNEEENTKTNES